MQKYEFSLPMPTKKEHIDDFVKINKKLTKSEITSLFFALPINSPDITRFEQIRTILEKVTYFDYWKEIIEKAKENNFDVIYLLNSSRPLLIQSSFLSTQLEKLDILIKNLLASGCNKVRISNLQLLAYIAKKYPEVEIYVSTTLEYNYLRQYENLIKFFPQIKQIVLSHEVNKNFKLIKNLKKIYPNLDIEIMVNEGCISGCPLRNYHNMATTYVSKKLLLTLDETMQQSFFYNTCTKNDDTDFFKEICLSKDVFPWELETYRKIGINKFKLVGRDSVQFREGIFENFETYLLGIEDYNNIKNSLFENFNHHLKPRERKFLVKEIRPYLPRIEHFIKYGHLCASQCGIECQYCFKCAEKLEKKFQPF